jgi:hypothetical protein
MKGQKEQHRTYANETSKQWKWIQTECPGHNKVLASEIFCVDHLACDKFLTNKD